MILVGIGSNLPADGHGSPLETGRAALRALSAHGIGVLAASPWYESAPVPVDDTQPWFVNAVVSVSGPEDPAELLRGLHAVEAALGRTRTRRNEARILDLDLLDHSGRIETGWPVLPHPRMHLRAFVLLPLNDLAPDWIHPRLGRSARDLLADLPPGQKVRAIAPGAAQTWGAA